VNLILTMLLGGLWHGPGWTFIVWGGLHGFGLAITRYFQRATEHAARRFFAACGLLFVVGALMLRHVLPDLGAWSTLVLAWVFAAPLWAGATAWLGRDPAPVAEAAAAPSLRLRWVVEGLRIAMCVAGVGLLVALEWAPTWTWIPIVVAMWGLALAADVLERGTEDLVGRAVAMVRRGLAAVLVFHYVCLAWIFFRATSFDNALAILGQIWKWETDHPNLTPMVTLALVAGFAFHFFAEGSFRWLRDRFVALPAIGQGAVLAWAAMALRELGQPKLVPFIYFQF
jgi:D-alanyl-lipoteichoic acid acyltransferase DltB (MBOAT superfamily)